MVHESGKYKEFYSYLFSEYYCRHRGKRPKILGGLGCLCAVGGLFRSFRRRMNPRDDSNTSTRSLFPWLMLALTLLPGWNDLMSGSHMALPLLQSDHHPKLSPQRILWGVGNPIKRSKPRHSTLVSVYFFSLILLLLQFIICSFVVSLVIFCLYPNLHTHVEECQAQSGCPVPICCSWFLSSPYPILQLHTLFICF